MAAQPLSDPGPRPPVMTWRKASPVLLTALVFYGIRVIFEQFWFFAPTLLGIFVGAKTGSATLAAGATAASGLVEFFTGPVIEIFGAVMAIMVGFMGWGISMLGILFTNARLFKENVKSMIFLVGAFAISIVPVVGTVPSLLGTLVALYRQQIKRDKERLHSWETAQKAYQAQLRAQQRQQAAEIALARTQPGDMPQEEEPTTGDNAPRQEKKRATFEGEYSYAFAANDNEIPAQRRKAA